MDGVVPAPDCVALGAEDSDDLAHARGHGALPPVGLIVSTIVCQYIDRPYSYVFISS